MPIQSNTSGGGGSITETDPIYTADKSFIALKSELPTATSDLTNDSGFITSADVPTTLAELTGDSTHRLVTDAEKSTWNGKQDAGDYATNTALALKVDKIIGKGLSTNDYTDNEKINLSHQSGTNTGDQDLSPYATIVQVEQAKLFAIAMAVAL